MEIKNVFLVFAVYSDGTGYNLAPVIGDDDALEAITIQNLTFFYHPCGDITKLPLNLTNIVDNGCREGYTLCMFNMKENKLVALGTQKDMIFQMNGENMQVIFIRQPSTTQIRSSITLECSPKAKTSVLYAPLEKIDTDQVVSNFLSVKDVRLMIS